MAAPRRRGFDPRGCRLQPAPVESVGHQHRFDDRRGIPHEASAPRLEQIPICGLLLPVGRVDVAPEQIAARHRAMCLAELARTRDDGIGHRLAAVRRSRRVAGEREAQDHERAGQRAARVAHPHAAAEARRHADGDVLIEPEPRRERAEHRLRAGTAALGKVHRSGNHIHHRFHSTHNTRKGRQNPAPWTSTTRSPGGRPGADHASTAIRTTRQTRHKGREPRWVGDPALPLTEP